jgi:titin
MIRLRFLAILAALGIALGGLTTPPEAQAYWYGPAQNLSATDLGGGVTQFSWSPPNPANYRGVEPTAYWVTVRVGYRTYYCNNAQYSYRVNGTSCTISGLPYGVGVTLEVQPWDPYIGDETEATFVLCCEVPAAPASVVGSAGDGVASVTWSPPSNVGAAGTSFTYSVEIRPGGAVCTTDGNSCEIGGLVNGVDYTFYVSAANNSGAGPAAASQPVRPVGDPSEPLDVQAFLQKGSALVAWQGPVTNGGTPINRYVVVSSPDNLTCQTNGALECEVDGLSNGKTYTFTVTAFNAVGQSQASAPSKRAKLLNVSSSPRQIKTSRRGSSVTVRWKAPKSKGGSKIKRYVVTSSPGNKKCRTKKGTCTISGLQVGDNYVFSVQAQNKSGLSAPGRSKSIYIPVPPKAEQVIS